MEREKQEYIKKEFEKIDIILSEKQISQFEMYYELLIEKNKVMNLTGITEFDEVMRKHFLDSLSIVKAIEKKDMLRVL